MIIKINDTSNPSPIFNFKKKWHKRGLKLRQWLIREVEIVDGDLRYRFRCETLRESARCRKIFLKEPGTYQWIKNEILPGEVFYDIGANIGVYTILAAKCVGGNGRVYAFEPHCANFSRLLDNISVNHLQGIVIPCNFALHEEDGFFPFNYVSSQAGTSQSQLASPSGEHEAQYQAEISELKYTAAIDSLISSGKLQAPHHIKIDVDGNELLILRGMKKLLSSPKPPRSIQVEIDKRNQIAIPQFLESHNYVLSQKHYTKAGLRRHEQEGASDDHAFNMLFHLKA
jgi:FkbM family methyltransferase